MSTTPHLLAQTSHIHPWLSAVAKGVVEGFTEFLPISSTGHLVLVRDFFPLTHDPVHAQRLDNLFDVVIQLPAILAVVLLYRKTIFGSLRSLHKERGSQLFWLSIVAAFIPAGIAGFLFKNAIEDWMRPDVVAAALILGGLALIALERFWKPNPSTLLDSAERVPLKRAVAIGCFQCLSLVPGASRSGMTIIGARLMGLSRIASAEFSFFLALPTMLGAFTLKFYKNYKLIDWAQDGPILLIGSITAFVTAWICVALFIKFLQRHSLSVFGWYRIVLGAVILLSMRSIF